MSNEAPDLVAGDAILGKITGAIAGQRIEIRKALAELVESTKYLAAKRAFEKCPCGRRFDKCAVVLAIMEY